MSYEDAIPDNARVISEYTYQVYERLWFDNLAKNIDEIRNGLNFKTLTEGVLLPRNKPALVLGAGPSIKKYNQLQKISRSDFSGIIIACDRILKDCLDNEIEPHIVVSVDGTEKTAEFYKNINRNDSSPFPVACVNVFIHPTTLKRIKQLRLQTYWYVSPLDNPFEGKSITRIVYWMTKEKMIIPTLGNVGAMCWNISLLLGCNPIALVGLDFGYPPETKLEDTQYYKAYKKLAEMNNQPIERFYRKIKNPLGNEVLVGLNWDVYRHIFTEFAKKTRVKTYNVSPISSLYSKDITYIPLTKFLKGG